MTHPTVDDAQEWARRRQRVRVTDERRADVLGHAVEVVPVHLVVELETGGRGAYPLAEITAADDEATETESAAVVALGGGTAGRARLAALRAAGLHLSLTTRRSVPGRLPPGAVT